MVSAIGKLLSERTSTPAVVPVLGFISPMTVPVAARVLLGVPPENPVITTPRAAQTRYGYAIPAEAHLELRDKQKARVFGEGVAPSDEGLIESQAILGKVGHRV